jgi:hypothetical protein
MKIKIKARALKKLSQSSTRRMRTDYVHIPLVVTVRRGILHVIEDSAAKDREAGWEVQQNQRTSSSINEAPN